MTVRLLSPAELELDEAVAWYRSQAPGLGEAFLLEFLKVLRRIECFPQAWHPLGPEIRRCRMARFPYGVIYAPDAADLVDIAVAHLHRAPDYWRDRLKAPPG